TGTTALEAGSAYGTVTPPTSGNDRSHTGSWMITGTTSHLCSSAAVSGSSSGGTRKSERTKTNVWVGSSRRCCTRCSSAGETVSAGASKGRSSNGSSAV